MKPKKPRMCWKCKKGMLVPVKRGETVRGHLGKPYKVFTDDVLKCKKCGFSTCWLLIKMRDRKRKRKRRERV